MRNIDRAKNHKGSRQPGKGALEITEEAVHLLRLSPASLFASYYIGTLPFILGLLYFWADMSRSAFAYRHCTEAAFGLSLLFLWMKCWHVVFARQVRARVTGESPAHWTLSRIRRLIATQTIIQPSALFAIPIAALIALPFGWVYAFYHNVSVMYDEDEDVRTVVTKSLRQAMLWPGQNHVLIAVVSLFGLFVFVNLAIGILWIPELIRTLLGVETIFTLSGAHMLNTTFLATVCGITYLCVNPVVKAVYVLRCFYGESLRTGTDLKAELRSLLPKTRAVAACLFLLLCFHGTTSPRVASAGEDSSPSVLVHNHSLARTSVSPPELNHSISTVLERREYAWRMPREIKESGDGVLASFISDLIDWSRTSVRAIRRWMRNFLDWLKNLFPNPARSDRAGEGSDSGWMTSAQNLIFVLLALGTCILAISFWRTWRRRPARDVDICSEAIPATPDLTNDTVGADDLPVDGWLLMAQSLMERGELRLALRALYLGSLAYLSQREMVIIAKFKSDREYEQDLRRRAHGKPELLAAFGENVTIFEGAWYGVRDVTQAIMDQFSANIERIKACG